MILRQARRRWFIGLGVSLGIGSLTVAVQAAPYVPFPSQDQLREVQLAALACARDNTAVSCDQARRLGDALMDHPRLPANCKDLIWELLQKAQPAAVNNSFDRREALTDPAQRLLLVCRSSEKPEAATTPGSKPSGGSGSR